MSIYDVTDPIHIAPLAIGKGDTDGGTLAFARQIHSVFAWQAGKRAFAFIVDDEETTDVDIMEITDPRNPVQIAETGLLDWPDAQSLVWDVIAGEDAARLDLPVLRWLAAHRDPTLTQVMAVVRDLTGVWAALAAVIIWLVLGWRRGVRPLPAVSAWAGALLCALMVAFIVGRTPPPAAYAVAAAPPAPGSFPALGVTVTTAVAGLLATQVSLAVRSWGRAVAAWTAALLWAGAAGAAAAYLGTHWITDVAAAWALGAAWDAVLITAWWTRTRPQAGATPVPRHHAGPDATGAPHRGR